VSIDPVSRCRAAVRASVTPAASALAVGIEVRRSGHYPVDHPNLRL